MINEITIKLRPFVVEALRVEIEQAVGISEGEVVTLVINQVWSLAHFFSSFLTFLKLANIWKVVQNG